MIVEALASGLSYICSDIGPHQQVLAESDADKLQKFIQMDGTAMQEAALKTREKFHLKKMLDEYDRICRLVAAGK